MPQAVKENTGAEMHTFVARGDEQVFTSIGDEVVVMHVGTGRYYKVDEVGSRIWALLDTPLRVDGICDRLAEEYAVDREACERDVLAFLNDMIGSQLIRVVEHA